MSGTPSAAARPAAAWCAAALSFPVEAGRKPIGFCLFRGPTKNAPHVRGACRCLQIPTRLGRGAVFHVGGHGGDRLQNLGSDLVGVALRVRAAVFEVAAIAVVDEAVRDADLVVTATSSLEPVIDKDWISSGAHINAIGTHSPNSREIDSGTMGAARIFVDRRESALNESGDYLLAAKEGVVTPESIIAEIGELLIGSKSGRTSPTDITLFKSLGLAIEDVACADCLYRKATAENLGTWVNL